MFQKSGTPETHIAGRRYVSCAINIPKSPFTRSAPPVSVHDNSGQTQFCLSTQLFFEKTNESICGFHLICFRTTHAAAEKIVPET
jgi:hypothetical protein